MAFKKIICSQKGQALTEVGLILPFLLLLALGVIEVSNMIDTYLVLTHLTREGANMTSRQTEPSDALDAIIDSSCPLISDGPPCPPANLGEWRIIYSKIGPAVPDDCVSASNPGNNGSCPYIIQEQIARGLSGVDGSKRICPGCGLGDFTCSGESCPEPSNVPNIDLIGVGQTLHVIEAFYDYAPITPVGSFLGFLLADTFYERAIF